MVFITANKVTIHLCYFAIKLIAMKLQLSPNLVTLAPNVPFSEQKKCSFSAELKKPPARSSIILNSLDHFQTKKWIQNAAFVVVVMLFTFTQFITFKGKNVVAKLQLKKCRRTFMRKKSVLKSIRVSYSGRGNNYCILVGQVLWLSW